MLGYIFHQNMRNFSTKEFYNRCKNWKRAFTKIGVAMTPCYLIAGLTELQGDPSSLSHKVPDLLGHLDQGLKQEAVIISVWKKKAECIGIAYDPTYFTLEHAGSVWRLSNPTSKAKVKCFNVPKNNIVKSVIDLPPTGFGTSADYRSLAYVAGDIGGQRYIFGFIHNDLRNDRSGSFTMMGEGAGDAIKIAIKAMGDTNYDNNKAIVIFGGDFNVPARSIGKLTLYCELDTHKKPIPTSKSGKDTWDFWLSDTPLNPGTAFVHPETQNDSPLSDHTGITLYI